jgi:hypothetical protein
MIKTTVKLVLVLCFVFFAVCFSTCESSPSYSSSSYSRPSSTSQPATQPKWANVVLTGEDEPFLEGTTWSVLNSTFSSETYEFRSGGRLIRRRIHIEYEINVLHTFSWQRNEDTIIVIHEGGSFKYEGKYYPQTQRIMLTGEDSDGRKWDETWEPYLGSSIASVPVIQTPQQPSTIIIQPSAPTQSTPTPQATTPTIPTLQTGTYAWSNSGQNMTMRLNLGQVSVSLDRQPVWSGTYRINGNQLVITVNNPTSDYAQLRGLTFSYNVTSNTSFSGGGETWVRTGY